MKRFGSLFALGFECGGIDGEVETGRKGKAGYHLEVMGKGGHAAFAGAETATLLLSNSMIPGKK